MKPKAPISRKSMIEEYERLRCQWLIIDSRDYRRYIELCHFFHVPPNFTEKEVFYLNPQPETEDAQK